ncbi:hypothetical protein CH063_01386 [Colletotrichum higginsianum]|uniref:Uncharacterized protein n=1 Tax=Colletotrichum higginsianum (strain IMI 349063) TaxID=759273 RepID=H1V6M4_COLHI|nr:hypothetical protein CH063_01386 [Colletotrichum higginsianum]
MRASTLTVSLASVVVLLSSVQIIAAGADADKPGQRTKVQRSPASLSFKHNVRSPQDPDVFVSYDYGYPYPPSPPTTYAEQLSSTVTSLASGSEASYTKNSSVASITGTPGVSGSATTGFTDSSGATVTVSDTVVIYPPNSTNGGLSISSVYDYHCKLLRHRYCFDSVRCIHWVEPDDARFAKHVGISLLNSVTTFDLKFIGANIVGHWIYHRIFL